MSRQTWKKGNLYISYGRPIITPYHDEDSVQDMSDVMYFYYDITILQDKKTLFHASTYDFPKVQNLHLYIDEIMNVNMDNAYLLEHVEDGEFQRKVKYAQVLLEDSFSLDIEYFYKIERYDYFVKQSKEDKEKEWTEYILTISEMEKSKKYGGSDREDYGKSIIIKNVTAEDLLKLKDTATKFCAEAIRVHNRIG